MRDLTSRLREVLRLETGRAGRQPDPTDPSGVSYDAELFTLALDGNQLAAALGGTLCGPSCIAIDHLWDDADWHGHRRVESYRIEDAAPIRLLDPRLGETGWASRLVFFDVETTGLSGGAGTLAFLAGCGWFERGGFRVRQFLLHGSAGEHAMLDALSRIFDDASLLVTFNGRTFDVPLMETRWAFQRRDCPTSDLPHFDMLPPARRLWSRRGDADPYGARVPHDEGAEDRHSCTLAALERSVLRFHRHGDVPGLEIPSRYFHFLRTGRAEAIAGVLDHNRHDLLSLAAVMSRALELAAAGPDFCESAGEQIALARMYEAADDRANAIRAYQMAAASDDRDLASRALAGLALMLRRQSRHAEAAAAWQRILERAPAYRPRTPIERRAAEALAIYHEHRARDVRTAKRYAESLRADARGRHAADVEHRLGRLDRKLGSEQLELGIER